MPTGRWHWLVLGAIVFAALHACWPREVRAFEPPAPLGETIPTPGAARPAPRYAGPPGQVLQPPQMMRSPAAVPTTTVPPDSANRPLPINLATALRLSDARPILILAAQAGVQVAARQLEQARVLWLPDLNMGASFYQHNGGAQGNAGGFSNTNRNQFMAGGGPYAVVSTTDAYFAPLAARQVLRSRTLDLQAARNDALLSVAEAYFNVQQARGRLAGADDSATKAEALVQRVDALSAGLVSPIEANRVRTLLASLKQSAATARGDWGVASAELTRSLRLDPTALVMPAEPPNLQITLISMNHTVDELIPIGLTSRPELASQQALVQAALARLKQERMRPLMPSVLLVGDAVPTSPGNLLMGGIFASSNSGQAAPTVLRGDVAVEMVWALNNLGYGNRASVRERRAEQEQRVIELFRIQDTVAAEVAQAFARLESAGIRVGEAETGVRQAQISYAGNLKGLSETTRFGDLLVLVNRPQEVVAALQQLATAYDNYFTAINEYNRAQFRLYRALGYPSGILAYEQSLGPWQAVDTSRPPQMAPICPP